MRQEVKWKIDGGQDLERSVSWGSNSGHPKRNSAICRLTALKAIGADNRVNSECILRIFILNLCRFLYCAFTLIRLTLYENSQAGMVLKHQPTNQPK